MGESAMSEDERYRRFLDHLGLALEVANETDSHHALAAACALLMAACLRHLGEDADRIGLAGVSDILSLAGIDQRPYGARTH